MTAQSNLAAAQKTIAPERPHLRIGFVPLTDCAPLVVAKMMDFGRRHGLELELCRQPSWAAVRDKLLSGELDAAQTLYGLVYGVQLGLGGPQSDMAILMTLNRNGQAITLSNQLADAVRGGSSLKSALAKLGRKPVFAQTFPTGTHAMWLNYWLASQDIHPLRNVESIVIPPPQMAGALAEGELDGFCAGEPWHAVAESNKAGKTIACTSEIWPDHPEKALACRREFAALYPNTVRALIQTVLEACRWLEAPANRVTASEWLARPNYINLEQDLIAPRLLGNYDDTILAQQPLPVRFFDEEGMNFPLVADGLWFLGQFHRWGMLSSTTEWERIAADVCQTDHYLHAAQSLGLETGPVFPHACHFIDGRVWDGSNAVRYSEGFAIRA